MTNVVPESLLSRMSANRLILSSMDVQALLVSDSSLKYL